MGQPLIAIINTDRDFLEMISTFLQEEGYATVILSESQEEFEVIKQCKPQFVMIELLISHPEHGLMVLNKVRLDPQTAHIPVVIASTATQLVRENELHLRAKGCDILLKPFDLEELLTIVGKVVPPPSPADS